MKPTFRKSEIKSITNNFDIEKSENELDVKWPQQYKEFLLEGNYGDPEPRYFLTKYVGQCLSFFCSLEDIVYFTSDNWEEEGEPFLKIPKTMIVIARTLGDDSILLGIGEDNYNKIYRLNYSGIDVSEELDEDEPEIWLVADSFDEFINSFCDEEEYMSSNIKLLDVVYYRTPKE